MPQQLAALGIPHATHIASLTQTAQHYKALQEMVAPQGRIALIDDPPALDILPLKRKSVSIHWEAMFARSTFETPDMIAQHNLLNEVSALVDSGVIRTTLDAELGRIDAANLRQAHTLIESGRARGKVVLTGF